MSFDEALYEDFIAQIERIGLETERTDFAPMAPDGLVKQQRDMYVLRRADERENACVIIERWGWWDSELRRPMLARQVAAHAIDEIVEYDRWDALGSYPDWLFDDLDDQTLYSERISDYERHIASTRAFFSADLELLLAGYKYAKVDAPGIAEFVRVK